MTIKWEDVRHGFHAVGNGLTAASPGIAAAGGMTGQPEVVALSALTAGAGALFSSLEKGGKIISKTGKMAKLHRNELVVNPRDAPRVGRYMNAAGMKLNRVR